MLVASSCDGMCWTETHLSSANNIDRLYQQNYSLQSRRFFKWQQLAKIGFYLNIHLKPQSQHNLSLGSVLVIPSMKAAIKPQNSSIPQSSFTLWYSPYSISYNYQLLISKCYPRASTNGKNKGRNVCWLWCCCPSGSSLIFWRKTSLKMKLRERVREAHRGESSYSKGARRQQIKAD